MTEKEAFDKIDVAIHSFKQAYGRHENIEVLTTPKTDWLTFRYRKLIWAENDLHYLIEIYPNFHEQEIVNWNVCAAAYYDGESERYYLSQKIAEHKTIELIAKNVSSLLENGFEFLHNIKRSDLVKLR